MYNDYPTIIYGINYSAADHYTGAEVMFFSKGLIIPDVKNPAKSKAA
jgi:DNA adenine methylase